MSVSKLPTPQFSFATDQESLPLRGDEDEQSSAFDFDSPVRHLGHKLLLNEHISKWPPLPPDLTGSSWREGQRIGTWMKVVLWFLVEGGSE